jgi:hypothetical protein
LIGTSVTDLGWLEPVPKDRPVLVVGEGLVHYGPAGELHRCSGGSWSDFPPGRSPSTRTERPCCAESRAWRPCAARR